MRIFSLMDCKWIASWREIVIFDHDVIVLSTACNQMVEGDGAHCCLSPSNWWIFFILLLCDKVLMLHDDLTLLLRSADNEDGDIYCMAECCIIIQFSRQMIAVKRSSAHNRRAIRRHYRMDTVEPSSSSRQSYNNAIIVILFGSVISYHFRRLWEARGFAVSRIVRRGWRRYQPVAVQWRQMWRVRCEFIECHQLVTTDREN